jgi:ferritin-like metal-binding protein YciE
MPAKTREELFVLVLSHLRQGTERTATILEELGDAAQNNEVKEALHARAFVTINILAKLDRVFKQIGKTPVKLTGRLHDVFVEDFHRELAEIESPEGKRLFVLARAHQLINLRTGEYLVLIAAADSAGYHGVGVLLESCLADTLAFIERNRFLIRNVFEARVAAAKSA